MKLSSINKNNLEDGTYYYCANCEEWFAKRQPAPNHKCPNCGWLWKSAPGTFVKKTTKIVQNTQQRCNNTPWFITLVLLGGGYCGYITVVRPAVLSVWRQIRIAWSNFIDGTSLLLHFISSILLSLAVLTLATSLLFYLIKKLIYFLVFLLLAIGTIFSRDGRRQSLRYQASTILKRHSLLIGTLTNLISSFCALLIASLVFQRPPDYWDFGLQFLIALVIQIMVFDTSRLSTSNFAYG